MPNDVYVKLQTVSENIVSLTIYESAEEIEKAVKSARYKEDQWIGGVFDALVSLREIPAADVEPVIHGRWIWHGEGYDCSECKKWVDGDIRYSFEDRTPFLPVYCPFCGAKMERGDSDAE